MPGGVRPEIRPVQGDDEAGPLAAAEQPDEEGLQGGEVPLQDAWWVAVFAGMALMLTVLAINFLGDAARDALDPRMERLG